MSASNPTISPPESFGKRLRHFAVGVLFALVLLIPRILHARRNPRYRTLFRIFLGVAGAALVILPLGFGTSFVPAVAGLAMFIAAILLPSAKTEPSTDDKARELAALVVVNGGRFKLAETPSFAAQLFVGSEHICVLDSHFQSSLKIPVNEITSAHVEESNGRWFLRVNWANKPAEFAHPGLFAEHPPARPRLTPPAPIPPPLPPPPPPPPPH